MTESNNTDLSISSSVLIDSSILSMKQVNTSLNNQDVLNNPSLNSGDEYLRIFNITQQITGLYLMPFISILGIIGNIFIVIVYHKSKKSSTNLYLIVLSMSDILKLFNDFLYFVVNLTNKLDPALGNKIFNNLYLYSHYIFLFTAINTSWLTCTIALDRYIAVVKSRGKMENGSYFKSIIITVFLLFISAVISLPSPLFLVSVQEFDPNQNATVIKLAETELNRTHFRKIYNYFNALAKAFIPLILLIYLDYQIIRVVYKNKMKKKAMASKKQKKKSSVTLMLITIILTFTLCMFPDAIMTMMQFGYANETYLVKSIREVTDLLLAINSAVTFPICYHFSIEFRSKFKKLFLSEEKILRNKQMGDAMSIAEENENLFHNTKIQISPSTAVK